MTDSLRMELCPAEGCEETEDVLLQECSPLTAMFTGGKCGHWGFLVALPQGGGDDD